MDDQIKLEALVQRIDMAEEETTHDVVIGGVKVVVMPAFLWDMILDTRRG